ncbi:hypothetical protein [Nostoc sp.]|uniref:hypothetical protein n=1 Tax=Nostoc sp. TaxID=1180 RepID=UPI002FFBB984
MDVDTYDALKKISLYLNTKSKKDNGFGKACQILLAITFCRLGFKVENYFSQGVDIDIWNHSQYPNFSVEVKTTIKGTVQLGEKDVQGLKKKEDEGYKTAFAVLLIDSLSGWLIVNAKGIKYGNIPLTRLNNQTRILPDLQKEVNQVFPKVIADYEIEILRRVSDDILMYLDKNLEKEKRNAALRDEEAEEDEKVDLTKNQFIRSDNASQFL